MIENIFILPQKSYKEKEYDNFLNYFNDLLNEYESNIKDIKRISKSEKENINQKIKKLKRILELYMNGSRGEAYKEFDELLKIEKSKLIGFSKTSIDFNSFVGLSEKFSGKEINNESIEGVSDFIKEIFIGGINFGTNPIKKNFNNFYRLRYEKEKIESPLDLFHRPFQDMEKIESYRYSIPGVPCLYLGKSLYISYKEINEPDKNHLWVSKFKLKKNLNYLDISKSLYVLLREEQLLFKELSPILDWINKIFKNYIQEGKNIIRKYESLSRKKRRALKKKISYIYDINKLYIINGKDIELKIEDVIKKVKKNFEILEKINIKLDEFLEKKEFEELKKLTLKILELFKLKKEEIRNTFILYPIFLACSIKIGSRDNSFKPEYVFPQMLMEWIKKEEDIDGICYTSTKIDLKDSKSYLSYPLFLNYALPIKSWKEQGYCEELKKYFDITKPLKWSECNTARSVKSTGHYLKENKYEETEYGKIEDSIN